MVVVVDAQVADEVGHAGVAAVLLHDQEGGRLLAALVTAGRLCRGERGGPRDDRADGEELRLHRHAPLRRLGVVGDERVRHPYVSSVRSSSSRSLCPGGTTTDATSGRASAALISSTDVARTTIGCP